MNATFIYYHIPFMTAFNEDAYLNSTNMLTVRKSENICYLFM